MGNDAESGNSDESDIDEAIIVATAFELLNTDQSYDEEADESSDDDDTDDDNGFDGFDPENSDVWKCLECKQPNTPYIRYCSACYKERKGWLPERPKPKKKRSKKTNGVLIKGEASSSANYERSDSQETVKSSSQDSGFSEDVSSQKNLEEVVESSESDEEIAKRNEGIKKSLAMANSSLALADSLCNLCF